MIRSYLTPQNFTEIKVPGTHELVFRQIYGLNDNHFSLRVLSGVNSDGSPRELGADALRVQVWVQAPDGSPMKLRGFTRIMRVKTWRKNLDKRLGAAIKYMMDVPAGTYPPVETHNGKVWAPQPHPEPLLVASPNPLPVDVTITTAQHTQPAQPKCPRCGSGMTKPKWSSARQNWFHGCLRYPQCHGAVDAQE